ncbi:MAG: prolipoprotein diacylglyceryl transferase [Gammaproteobacteria bacterium RIFCSPHIGHO2_02_FULL_42_13]|nr:MAG: prolipoprotein diacylglyceryl transferase [Gammaproteobacteria bacterium RIFCSPHIGHO2_02_FULL_42_13]OGT71140.1 MAG: prolipoprotein diacylglyceryl transferase [Gammaproteobacteria bacterium RIFCSPLOWO2_02_FULL_42_9]
MLIYPKMNPIAFHIGPLAVHWYGLMYLVSFILGWLLASYRVKKYNLSYTNEQLADWLFYIALGILLGGRIGYMLFYDFSNFIHAPWIIVQIWQGGMSFHGGLLGGIAALWFSTYKAKHSFFELTDFVAPFVPIGLAAGRIGNFINGELFGRVTNVPWAMVYPLGGPMPRHPIEIYEALLEGVLLFIILWVYSMKPRPRMALSGVFLLFYGLFRCLAEFFRQPDPQLGFIAWHWLTMGMALSVPMILGGIFLLWYGYKK